MTIKKTTLVLVALVAMTLAGCGGDLARQIATNEQLRGQVMDAIASDRGLALQVVDRIVVPDSLRSVVVDHLLLNKDVARQVILRIATNPDAFDMVLGVAVSDTAMRSHVLTLVKGIQMASLK